MKKFLVGAIWATSSVCSPLVADSGEDLPLSFYITERIISLLETFDLETDTKKLGSVTKRLFSLTTAFDYQGPKEEKIARAIAEFFSFGTVAHVFDAHEKEIGWIEEVLFTWISPAKYRIFDADNRLVAIARMDFWGTKFVISDPSEKKEIATIHRPWLRFFRDAWTVDIQDARALDPRLLVFVAVYQTDAEARARARRERERMERQREEDDEVWMETRLGLMSLLPAREKEESALLQELDGFDFLADDQIIATWSEHEKEYEEMLLPFSREVLSHLFLKLQRVEREKTTFVTQKEFENHYDRLQRDFFLESVKEGAKALKDPNISDVQKKILYNLLKELKKERS